MVPEVTHGPLLRSPWTRTCTVRNAPVPGGTPQRSSVWLTYIVQSHRRNRSLSAVRGAVSRPASSGTAADRSTVGAYGWPALDARRRGRL